MRMKTILLVVVALVLAGFTALLVRNWLDAQRAAMTAAPARPAAPAGVQVLVAKQDLPVGTFLRPEHLRWQVWPESSLSPSYAVEGKKKIEDFVGSVVRLPIAAGEPITEGRVVAPGNSGFLAAVLRPGYRAVSVPVTVTSGISGFVFPGDHVDLILTHVIPQESGSGSEQRRAGVTVLRDIRVLALDQRVDVKPGETTVARTVTLEVTPKQSEMIAVIVEAGKLSMSLRSLARDDQALAGGDTTPKEPKRLPERTFTLDTEVSGLLAMRRVNVLRGDQADELKFTPR